MAKILLVISSLKSGGAERTVSNLTMNFPKDWEIDILLNNDKHIEYPYRGRILSLELEGKSNMSSLLFHFRLLIRRIIKLRSLKKTKRYDACISFMDSANIANILSGNKYTKVIGSVRTNVHKQGDELLQYKYTVNPLIRLLYNKADVIVAVSSRIRKSLVEDFGLRDDKVVTIENGCDISALKQQANEPLEEDLLEGKKIIVNAGRLSEAKGQWHLIRAFSRVIGKENDAVLLILGAGPLEGYLKQVSEELGIQNKVIFKGFVQNPHKYIAKADVFVMSSLYEGYGNVVAEAVCLGVPCIATDYHSGAREILAPALVNDMKEINEVYEAEYGILTPVCSGTQYEGKEELEFAEVKMAEAIRKLLEDENRKKYYAAKSMERSKEFGIESAIQKWVYLVSGNEEKFE